MANPYDAKYTNSDGDEALLSTGSRAWRSIPNVLSMPSRVVWAKTPYSAMPALFQTQVMEPREISMGIDVSGSNPTAVVREVTQLLWCMAIDLRKNVFGHEQALGTFTYWGDNDTELAIRCVPTNHDGIDQWLHRFQLEGARATLPLKFWCPDPTFYAPTKVSPASAPFNGAANVTISCVNPSMWPAYIEVSYTGICENPKMTDYYGTVWELEKDAANAGDETVMVLDPHDFQVTHTPNAGAAANVFNLISEASTWPPLIAPGTNDLTFICEAGGNATIQVGFYTRYPFHGRLTA